MKTGGTAIGDKLNPAVVLMGTAQEGKSGPPMGIVDIGVSEKAYLCRISLPGVRKNESELSVDIKRDGTVQIRGVVTGPEMSKKSSTVYHMRVQELSPPGRFTVSFNLPGPVDPRLASPTFRPDGILEITVFKANPVV